MPDVYVANTSLHHHELRFALERGGKVYRQRIPIGGQIRVLDRSLTAEELGFFIARQERYGTRNVREMGAESKYVGLCYSVDRPVQLNAIKGNLEHNAEVLDEQRDRRLEQSTVAIANMLEKTVAPAPTPLRRSTVEFTEETKGTDTPRIGVGVEFTAAGVEPANRGKLAKRA
jgi:hypothetical protein